MSFVGKRVWMQVNQMRLFDCDLTRYVCAEGPGDIQWRSSDLALPTTQTPPKKKDSFLQVVISSSLPNYASKTLKSLKLNNLPSTY
jgi:hypothetical protein